MSRVAIILGVLLVLCWGSAPRVAAQESSKGPFVPVKLDEFGSVGHCDMGARLDNAAISYQNLKGATLHIVTYAPPGDKGGSGPQLLELMRDYLINARGIDPDNIKTVYAGRNSDLTQPRIQLWIVPENTVLPEPEKFENNLTTFKGMFFEREMYDDVNLWYDLDVMEPGIGRSIHSSFADMLEHQKNAAAYIVSYNGDESLPGAWRRAADKELELFKERNIDPSRFKVIFGGRQKQAKLQLWILPKEAPPPVRDAGREPAPKKAIDAGTLDADFLNDKEYEARSFRAVLTVLEVDKTMRAFLVVRLEGPPLKEEEEATKPETTKSAAPASGEEPETEKTEPVDLTKLIEKWRIDLTTTHKIRSDRIIIIFLPGTETAANSINVWFVPKGQPLPDPNEEAEEEEPEPSAVAPGQS